MKGYIVKGLTKGAEKASEELVKEVFNAITAGLKDAVSTDNKTKEEHKRQEDRLNKYRDIILRYENEIDSFETELSIEGISEERKEEIKSKLKSIKEDKSKVEDEYIKQIEISKLENEYQESKNKSLNIPAIVGVAVAGVATATTSVLLLKKNKSSDIDCIEDVNVIDNGDDIIQG